tara:strand:+ start:1037 stop:1366 length:330 start_codon:yes stop_codon:yes gene_type:complete
MWRNLIFVILAGCAQDECPASLDYFVNTWWQIKLTTGPIGNCYLFNDDGIVVESDGISNWPVDTWESQEEECEFIISTPATEFRLLEYKNECWDISYEDENLTACDCQL